MESTTLQEFAKAAEGLHCCIAAVLGSEIDLAVVDRILPVAATVVEFPYSIVDFGSSEAVGHRTQAPAGPNFVDWAGFVKCQDIQPASEGVEEDYLVAEGGAGQENGLAMRLVKLIENIESFIPVQAAAVPGYTLLASHHTSQDYIPPWLAAVAVAKLAAPNLVAAIDSIAAVAAVRSNYSDLEAPTGSVLGSGLIGILVELCRVHEPTSPK